VHNRAGILEAAARMFAERGVGVDVREIARAAGVGMGTLYRHFPTKDQLVEAVLADVQEDWVHTTQELLTTNDPWPALCRFMEDTLTRHAAHRGLLESFGTGFRALPSEQAVNRTSIEPVIAELVAGARAQGKLRDDVTSEDIGLLLIAIGRTIEVTEEKAPGTWRRSLTVVLNGLRGER
jgi:AcrR family transcriptional regulator